MKETRAGEKNGGDKEGEAAYSKEVVGEPHEMQGSVPVSISPEEMTLDSNEGQIRKVVMAAEAKRGREEEEEVVPLLRKKRRVSQETAKDEEPKSAEQGDGPESPIWATSFDRLAAKMKKKRAKLTKELRALRNGAEKIAKDALSSKEACREVRP